MHKKFLLSIKYLKLLLKHLLKTAHTIKVNKTENKLVLWIKMNDIQKEVRC